MRKWYFMDGRTCMKQASTDNYGIGSRDMCDDCIGVAPGCPTLIIFRNGIFLVTITLSPQKCTVHPEFMNP